MEEKKPEKNKVHEEISELEETIKESEKDKKEKSETQEESPLEDFEINPDFVEDLNLIDFPSQTEPIFQRIQDSEETLEQNLQFVPTLKSQEKKYDESKYESKYFEDKYSEETPNYTATSERGKKETSDSEKNQTNQFR